MGGFLVQPDPGGCLMLCPLLTKWGQDAVLRKSLASRNKNTKREKKKAHRRYEGTRVASGRK